MSRERVMPMLSWDFVHAGGCGWREEAAASLWREPDSSFRTDVPTGVQLCVQPARKGRPMVWADQPWEHKLSWVQVMSDEGRYRMWYSYRGDRYRIGLAESDDGLVWRRRDAEAGIDTSEEGWDSAMVEYPCVFVHEGRRYMLYNGDGYGETGVGLAVEAE